MKVVFDTNIYVSAFVLPGSKAEKAILKILDGEDTLVISKEIIDETLTVLSGKFKQDREAISRTAIFLSDIAELVTPSKKIKILKDDPDNRIIECAVAGKASVIVTGDKRMLEMGSYQGISIISLKEFLES